jgi:hypothetical protein
MTQKPLHLKIMVMWRMTIKIRKKIMIMNMKKKMVRGVFIQMKKIGLFRMINLNYSNMTSYVLPNINLFYRKYNKKELMFLIVVDDKDTLVDVDDGYDDYKEDGGET